MDAIDACAAELPATILPVIQRKKVMVPTSPLCAVPEAALAAPRRLPRPNAKTDGVDILLTSLAGMPCLLINMMRTAITTKATLPIHELRAVWTCSQQPRHRRYPDTLQRRHQWTAALLVLEATRTNGGCKQLHAQLLSLCLLPPLTWQPRTTSTEQGVTPTTNTPNRQRTKPTKTARDLGIGTISED